MNSPIGNGPQRAGTELVEMLGRHGGQLLQSPGGDLAELLEHLGARTRAARRHPGLVPGPHPVVDMRSRSGTRRGGLPQQPALRAHHVRHEVAHCPPRALRGQLPLAREQFAPEGGDGPPLLGQQGDDLLSHGRRPSHHPGRRATRSVWDLLLSVRKVIEPTQYVSRGHRGTEKQLWQVPASAKPAGTGATVSRIRPGAPAGRRGFGNEEAHGGVLRGLLREVP